MTSPRTINSVTASSPISISFSIRVPLNLASSRANHLREERRSRNQLFQHHRLMRCMSALADSTHSVESGDSDCRCKVTVGTPAGRSFFQFEPDLCCECRGAAKERDGCTASFHGWPVHSTLHMQDAAAVPNAQGAKPPIDPRCILGP